MILGIRTPALDVMKDSIPHFRASDWSMTGRFDRASRRATPIGKRVRYGFYTVSAYLQQQIYGRWIYRRRHEHHDTPRSPDEPGAARRRGHQPWPLADRLFWRYTQRGGTY